MASLLERHRDEIRGVISCFDRVILRGTLPVFCHAKGMTSYLYAHNIRIFDYPLFAQPLREQIRENAENLARENGIEIEFIRKASFRKEERVKEILAQRGHHPGLVCILSAMESCTSYKPWHNKTTGKTFLKPDSGKCLHYYFYFIDEELGLCHVRVPTWCPFRLQVYFNGHHQLAAQLRVAGITYQTLDNAFTAIADIDAAQKLANDFDISALHCALDRFALLYCPVIRQLGVTYHWSIAQIEYSTDVLFKRQSALTTIYNAITRTAIHAVKADDIATFLGRKLTKNYQDELGNNFGIRIEGTRIKHRMGSASIKMYDKCGLVLRIETTANDVSFFKHHRKVEQRDGTSVYKLAPLKKSIYSLGDLRELLAAANRRYLEFVSQLDDPTPAMRNLEKIAATVVENGRTYKGFNFFDLVDIRLFEALVRGENNITGLRNKDLQQQLPEVSCGVISRALKRLRVHGLVKRVRRTYKYYVTQLGCAAITAGLILKELFLVPALDTASIS